MYHLCFNEKGSSLINLKMVNDLFASAAEEVSSLSAPVVAAVSS